MKRLILMFLVGVSIIFFGCSKMDTLAPELNPNDQLTSTLKKGNKKTHFTGICTPVVPPPLVNTWYDLTDDVRVTGTSLWYTKKEKQIGDIVFMNGTGELILDDNLGKWRMKWYGTQTFTIEDESTFKIVSYAVGTGIEGEVKGLTAKWKYSMDFDGNPETLFYIIKGQITDDI